AAGGPLRFAGGREGERGRKSWRSGGEVSFPPPPRGAERATGFVGGPPPRGEGPSLPPRSLLRARARRASCSRPRATRGSAVLGGVRELRRIALSPAAPERGRLIARSSR